MPPTRKASKSASPVAAEAGVDRIGALPDEVLHHMLSFLRAQDAVRTCVLARRWRHLWRSATGLRIGGEEDSVATVNDIREFVDNLLLLRGRAPLDKFEISLVEMFRDDWPRVNLWIRHALMCEVQVLRLDSILCRGLPLSSKHLTRLDLDDVCLSDDYLDFSSCLALQILDISRALIDCAKIASRSLKYLSITKGFFSSSFRTHIYAPSLISLRLVDNENCTPTLDGMPSLVDAFVRFTTCAEDCCTYSNYGDCGLEKCEQCYGSIHDNKSFLLEGLSEASSLALISETNTVIFRRDLNKDPIFNKLKTLLLNEYWCVAPDFNALTCIFKHTPVLEKLTIQLFSTGHRHEVEMKGRYFPMEKSAAISEHLKIVEIKCKAVDQNVLKVLKFLCTFNIYFSFK